jgi:high-affinity Fe2+/Pb2+ permease
VAQRGSPGGATQIARKAAPVSRRGTDCRNLEAGSQIARVQEAVVTGLILAVFIGVLVAFGWTRLRGKLKMGVSTKDWLGPIVVVVIVALLLWASQGTH